MRILYVIQELQLGGAERVVATLQRAMVDRGHEAAAAAAWGPLVSELQGPHFELPRLNRRVHRVPAAALTLGKAIRAFRPDVVHCHNPGMAAIGGLATRRGRRVAALTSVHGVVDNDYTAAARVLRLAGLPVVACGRTVAAALERNGVRLRATVVNGISPAPVAADRAALEEEWQITPGRKLVVLVGRLAPGKDQTVAIRAVAGVPDAVLVLVGDGSMRQHLEHEARRAAVADRVVFAGPRRDARAIVAAADVAVSSSRSEGLPLAVLEALAGGTPLVATDIPGNREVLGRGNCALIVAPGDAKAMGDALRRVLENPGLAQELAAAGRELAGAYTDDAMIDAYSRLYHELLAERNTA
jgi:glycosyltransferase involved in cell wall biosynthesis